VVRRERDLAQDVLHLACADRPVERAETDCDAARLAGLLELTRGVDLSAVGTRRERGEVELAAAGQADAIDSKQVDQLADASNRIALAAMADVVRSMERLRSCPSPRNGPEQPARPLDSA
jgi:hypothetical protein